MWDIKATLLRRSIIQQHRTTLRFKTEKKKTPTESRMMERDGWQAKRKKSMMTTVRGGGKHAGGGVRLRPQGREGGCLLYEQLVKVLVCGVLPRAASLNVAAALKLPVIHGPIGPKLILYPHKALMQGKVGANGTLGKQGKGGVGGQRGQPDADAVMDRTEDGHRQDRQDHNENKPL